MLNTIIVSRKNAGLFTGKLIAQTGDKLVFEVEALPTCSFSDASSFTGMVHQRCLPGGFEERMTIADIQEAKALIEALGDFAKQAKRLGELKLMKQVTDAEMALVDMYEEVLNG